MPRVGRIYQRALCYHVMNRGVNRSQVFGDDQDRRYFSQLVGEYKDEDRLAYGEALMSVVDETVVRSVEGERVLGSREFAATLKMERGRYRVKRGKPARRVPITPQVP